MGVLIDIAATSDTVLIQNSTFYANVAGRIYEPGDGTGGRGGAIFNAGTDTWIKTSTLDFNIGGQAYSTTSNGGDGGGIDNQGTITITNCTIYNNRTGSSDHAASGNGGGVVNSGGEMDLNESTIVTNAIASGVTYGSLGGIRRPILPPPGCIIPWWLIT